jgi:DNA-binding response OmpR family regulator
MKVLLIEDEVAMAESILEYLGSEGYRCEWVRTADAAQEKIHLYAYDCLLVDIALPDGNGLDLIDTLKKDHLETGIIIISARNSIDDKIAGLNLGSDDYLTKPFHLSELNARIKSIIRRRSFSGNRAVSFDRICIQPDQQRVEANGQVISLTKKEYDLLMYLIANKNRVLSKESIAEYLWGDTADLMDNFDFIYTHIKNLRRKLLDEGCPDYIQSVYGVGYKLAVA